MNVKFNRFVLRYSHFFVYVLIFLLIFFNGRKLSTAMSLIYATVDTLFFAVLYQLLCKLLIQPPQWLQSKALRFVVVMLIMVFACQLLFSIEYLVHIYTPIERPQPNSDFLPYITLANFLKVLILNLSALCIAIYKYSLFTLRQTEELKQEQKLMKLQLLQSQINPHFLFNSLNNIYALVYTKNDIAPDALLKLSDMLRYVTDFGQQEKVSLDKELAYIQNYIDFQILRFGQNEHITYQSQFDSQSYSIAPMLLQPFVENCFTHSDLTTNPEGFVHIRLEVKNAQLVFQTENSIVLSHSHQEHKKGSSVGIDNVEQRLRLYYPDEHSLTMGEDDGVYKVKLTIDLR
ncbi:MAG: sensor histidine kinase [Bacteroidales bacterium]|nr:sensor histidine kinase [Bacteroidales bacterium]